MQDLHVCILESDGDAHKPVLSCMTSRIIAHSMPVDLQLTVGMTVGNASNG